MISLTVEQSFLLHILSCAVQRRDPEPQAAGINWSALLEEARYQAVSLLLFDALPRLTPPVAEDVYQESFRDARRCIVANMRAEHAQNELIRELDGLSMPYVILKGESAAAFYPNAQLRQLGDVDFLVTPEHADLLTDHMQSIGYTHSWEPGDYHQVLQKPGALLELHRSVAGVPEGAARQPVQEFLDTLLQERILLRAESGSFYAPCHSHQALILLLHMQHHIVAKGMGLRQLMDWACLINATWQDSFWEDRLLPLLRTIGLYTFAAVTTRLCSLYLGSHCPAWAQQADTELCHALMEDILSSGNFGRKDDDRAGSLRMLPNWETEERSQGKLRLLYRTLRHSALTHRPELQDKPVRLFFVMLGRAVRYIFLFLRGKRPNLLRASAHADKRRAIYQQLHMFEP